MKILITGAQGLAKALKDVYADHQVTLVSRSNGFDIKNVNTWGTQFLDYDCVFNSAYDGFSQVELLEFFYDHWKNDASKKIITIGSRVITYKRSESELGYWPYRLHKQALQQAHDAMLLTAKCDMKIIHPGPIDTAMIKNVDCVKMSATALAQDIRNIVMSDTIKRVDLWL